VSPSAGAKLAKSRSTRRYGRRTGDPRANRHRSLNQAVYEQKGFFDPNDQSSSFDAIRLVAGRIRRDVKKAKRALERGHAPMAVTGSVFDTRTMARPHPTLPPSRAKPDRRLKGFGDGSTGFIRRRFVCAADDSSISRARRFFSGPTDTASQWLKRAKKWSPIQRSRYFWTDVAPPEENNRQI